MVGPPLPPVSPPIHKYTILLASLAVAVQDRASEVSSRGPFSSVHPRAPDPPFDGGEDPFWGRYLRTLPTDSPRPQRRETPANQDFYSDLWTPSPRSPSEVSRGRFRRNDDPSPPSEIPETFRDRRNQAAASRTRPRSLDDATGRMERTMRLAELHHYIRKGATHEIQKPARRCLS